MSRGWWIPLKKEKKKPNEGVNSSTFPLAIDVNNEYYSWIGHRGVMIMPFAWPDLIVRKVSKIIVEAKKYENYEVREQLLSPFF